jgi:hypothetical protein
MVNRPDLEVHRLQAAKGAFDAGQALVAGDDLRARQRFGGDAGADDIEAVEALLALDGGLFALI